MAWDRRAISLQRDLFLANPFSARSVSDKDSGALRRDLFEARLISSESISNEICFQRGSSNPAVRSISGEIYF